MKKLLVICGPTAIGKTRLAIKLAKKFDGELVSADSRQVYKYMDTGTSKDLPVNSKLKTQSSKPQLKSKNYQIGYYKINGIKAWLLDIVKPDYRFSVADYVRCADLVIEDIWQRKKLPILVGGTGFYIKGIVDGIETIGIAPDWRLRKKLRNLEIEKLKEVLKETCPERLRRMNKSDRNNPRRLVRAIEIAMKTQSAKRKAQNHNLKLKTEEVLMVGLKAQNRILYQRIDERVDERVKLGIIEEIQRLIKMGYSWDNSVLGKTLGYKEFKPYFEGKADLDEAVQRWKFGEHRYARRQMTWFKKNKRINWFDITKKNFEESLENSINSWYSKN